MGADNWTDCPRCARRHSKDIDNANDAAASAYGEVSVEEFDAMRAAVQKLKDNRPAPNFGERYDVGLEGTNLYVRYTGSCRTCKLSISYADDVTIDTFEGDAAFEVVRQTKAARKGNPTGGQN